MDEIRAGHTTEVQMVIRALRTPFGQEAIRLLTRLDMAEVMAAIDELAEESPEWLDPRAVQAVAFIINRSRGDHVPVDMNDRLEAIEALEDAMAAVTVR